MHITSSSFPGSSWSAVWPWEGEEDEKDQGQTKLHWWTERDAKAGEGAWKEPGNVFVNLMLIRNGLVLYGNCKSI